MNRQQYLLFIYYIFYCNFHLHRWPYVVKCVEGCDNHRMWKSCFDLFCHTDCFLFSDKGLLHKTLVLDGEVHTVEEIQLLKNAEPIKTLLLSTQVVRTRNNIVTVSQDSSYHRRALWANKIRKHIVLFLSREEVSIRWRQTVWTDSVPLSAADHLRFLTYCVFCSSQARFLYAGSDSGVVQSPTAFCEKYPSCVDCVLARDPYCAWDPSSTSCVNIFQHDADRRWEMRSNVHTVTDSTSVSFTRRILVINFSDICRLCISTLF